MVDTRYRIIIALLGLLLSLPGWAALTAEVDRQQLALNETLTLTVTLDHTTREQPDLQPLKTLFEVLSSTSESSYTLNQGRHQASQRWQYTLAPKRVGTLVIPPMEAAGERSEPLTIEVTRQPQPRAAGSTDQTVWLETSLSQTETFVQQTVVLTVEVYQGRSLEERRLTQPEFDHATLTKLGEETFQRRIDGKTYQVDRLRYALMPMQSGELAIPELVFTGTEVLPRRSLFDPIRSRPHRALSDPLTLTVKPIPSQWPADQPWLPARNLTLKEQWSAPLATLQQGEAITRQVTLQADGVTPTQLPTLDLSPQAGGRGYADQPDTQALPEGAERTERMAIIPTDAVLQLPELKVAWWDIDQQTIRFSRLPARRLPVQVDLSRQTPAVEPPSAPQPAMEPTVNDAPTALSKPRPDAGYWPGISAGLALGWLLTLGLWWRSHSISPKRDGTAPLDVNTVTARQAYQQLQQSCRRNDAQATRRALLAWATAQNPGMPPTLQAIAQQWPPLAEPLAQLDASLYRASASNWKGASLLQRLRTLASSTASEHESQAVAIHPH